MADKTSFRLTGKWKKLKLVVDASRFDKVLEGEVERATKANAITAAAAIRKRMTARVSPGNSAFTRLVKGSSKALIDDGDLFLSVTHVMIDERTALAGVLRTARDKRGEELANLAIILHEGATLGVTPAMRGLFMVLAKVGQGKMSSSELSGRAAEIAQRLGNRIRKIKPLKASTNTIVIPPRPFLRRTFANRALLKQFKETWERALEGALKP